MPNEALPILDKVMKDLIELLELYNHRKIRRFYKYISKLLFKETVRVLDELIEELDSNDCY